MKVRPILLVNLLIVVLMAGFALWAAGKAPAGMQLPTHWNMHGEVDSTAPALTAFRRCLRLSVEVARVETTCH